MKLPFDFYNRNVVEVAIDLLGQHLVFGGHRGIITETEAYSGADDPASHAYNGPTKRAAIMFGKAAISYVYLIYGMYNCLNIVTDKEDEPSAVLIRGIKLITPLNLDLNGPGKLCRHLNITTSHTGIDLCNSNELYVCQGEKIKDFKTTPRIGITKAVDRPWRFVVK
jgi:DNA-3-methyladenine glycosylase